MNRKLLDTRKNPYLILTGDIILMPYHVCIAELNILHHRNHDTDKRAFHTIIIFAGMSTGSDVVWKPLYTLNTYSCAERTLIQIRKRVKKGIFAYLINVYNIVQMLVIYGWNQG